MLTWLYSSFAPKVDSYIFFVMMTALSVLKSIDIPRDSRIPDTFTPELPTEKLLPNLNPLSSANLEPMRTELSLLGYPPEVRLSRMVFIELSSSP